MAIYQVFAENSAWVLVPQNQTKYHDNGVGNPEQKYTCSDGREAVFDGDTLEPITDPKYKATFNYYPIVQVPSTGAGLSDYVVFVRTSICHWGVDVLPYWLTGCSNTREQFEEQIKIFD